MRSTWTEFNSLLHCSRNDIMMRFGIPDVDHHSICIYCQQEQMLILVFGLEEKKCLLEETVQGYALGTKSDGIIFCEGIVPFDGKENTANLPEDMTMEELCQQYTVVDIGSGTCRPAMIGKNLSLWLVRTDREGKIRKVWEERPRLVKISAEEAESVFDQILKRS